MSPEQILADLNPEEREAAETVIGPVVILAGAGTSHGRRELALMVLDLTPYEVGNALLRGRSVPASRVAIVLEALADICPRVTPTRAEMQSAARLVERHGLTLYDAVYASVARARGARLATLDRALLAAGLGLRPGAILAR